MAYETNDQDSSGKARLLGEVQRLLLSGRYLATAAKFFNDPHTAVSVLAAAAAAEVDHLDAAAYLADPDTYLRACVDRAARVRRDLDDDVLLDRAKVGDTAALGEMWQRTTPWMVAIAARWELPPHTSAEDVAQEVWLKHLSRNFRNYRRQPGGSFRKWFRAVLENALRDACGRGRSRVVESLEARMSGEDDDETHGRDFPDPAADTEAEALERIGVHSALQNLSARKAFIIRACHLDDRQGKEVAKMLGVSPARVSQIKDRAERDLRRHYTGTRLSRCGN